MFIPNLMNKSKTDSDYKVNYIYETIEFSNNLPMRMFVHSVNYVQNHWHESIELLFILSGTVNIVVDGNRYELKEEDIILINSNEIHTTILSGDNNLILVLQISPDFIKENCSNSDNIIFNCKSFLYNQEEQHNFNIIRKILAEMMWFKIKDQEGYELKVKSLLLNLVYILIKYFKVTEKRINKQDNSKKFLERLTRIINYIDENYNKDISLQDIADKEYLTIHYLSKFFKKYVGITIGDYINKKRLEHAVKDIIFTDLPIIQIALNNGFPNEKSFLNIFKEYYNITPSQYRKNSQGFLKSSITEGNKIANYFEVDNTNVYKALFKYLNLTDSSIEDDKGTIKITNEIDLQKHPEKIYHKWKTLLTVGKAKDILFAEVQRQLQIIQKEIGFKYIRFHGIFDDEMMVYNEDQNNNPIFNFSYIDRVIDFILSIGLKPFIELGFMPSKLAKTNNTIFYRKSIISMPYDINKWNLLIKEFINHLIFMYGKKEIEKWYFEVWNEADFTNLFWFDKEEDYFILYKNTYDTLKSISKDLKVGGSSFVRIDDENFTWVRDFIKYCLENSCKPDFITYHCYPLRTGYITKTDISMSLISENENYLSDFINRINLLLKEYNMENIDKYITEWNSTTWHRDLTNDTCYKAAFITKNITQNMDKVEGLGYWTFTDFIEEIHVPKETFHGGLGFFTINGIKKAGYYAYWLLNKLGTKVIDSGEYYYVTSSCKGYQVLLFNYCHFDKLYCNRDLSNINIRERYNVFKDNFYKEINLSLKGFKSGKYNIRKYYVNQNHGSAFDTWIKMGAPEYFTKEEIEYINNKSQPLIVTLIQDIEQEYLITEKMSPHEVILYEFNIL
ncbi:helix-turn-helix domain-containing protein [Caldicellulosiruptoraceae bacterium PP1]